jgi:hypothetical protein
MRQRILWVLWPSFVVGGIAETLFFAFFDPHELTLFGEPLALSRQAVYSLGFFFFWGVGAAAAALTTFLQQSPWEVNRCPLPAMDRPERCPKREPG